jgi:hypothetical protein
MTDRVRTLTVILDQDMRTDDVKTVVKALKMIRYVDDVELGSIDIDLIERRVARQELRTKVMDALREVLA